MRNQLTALTAATLLLAAPVIAQESVETASQAADQSVDASEQSAEASVLMTAAGVQVASGASALPLAASGAGVESAGGASVAAGDAMWDAANTPIVIDDAVMMAGPAPDVAMAETEADDAATTQTAGEN